MYRYRRSAADPTPHLVNKPAQMDFAHVRETLMHVVPLCLDSDPALIPLSCKALVESADGTNVSSVSSNNTTDDDRDADDFSFWSEKQAKRISACIKQIFDVEYAPEVVLAHANLTALANRILVSREVLSSGP